jgi:hypothetical protein
MGARDSGQVAPQVGQHTPLQEGLPPLLPGPLHSVSALRSLAVEPSVTAPADGRTQRRTEADECGHHRGEGEHPPGSGDRSGELRLRIGQVESISDEQ